MDGNPTIHRLAIVLLVLLSTGCSVLGRKHDVVCHEEQRCSLRQIDEIHTENYSETPPTTVEEGVDTVAEEVRNAKVEPEFFELSLADVRASALENNLDLQVELLNPAIAAENVPIEEGRFDALLGFNATRLHLDTPDTLSIPVPGLPPVAGRQFDSRLYEPNVTLPSRTGGSLRLSRPMLKTEDSLTPANYESDWRFSITQPLLRGAGLRVNTAPIRIAKFATLQTDAAARLEVIRVLAAADRQYWILWAAKKELEIREQQYELALEQLEDVENLVAPGGREELGVKPAYEITRAQAGVARRVEAMIVAKANVQLAQRELKRVINMPALPIESTTSIELLSDPNPVGLELDPALLAEMALEQRPELRIQHFRLHIDNINVGVANNSRFPRATLDANSSINGAGSSFGEAREILYGGRFADYGVGLNVAFPLPNQTARASHRQAQLSRSQTMAERERLELQIRQEVYDSVTRQEQNWRRILAATNNVRFATRDLDVERRLFEAGEQNRTTTEVLNAAARLGDAQSSEVQAVAAHQISLVDVAFATGTLMGFGQVRWHDNVSCHPPPRMAGVSSAVEVQVLRAPSAKEADASTGIRHQTEAR